VRQKKAIFQSKSNFSLKLIAFMQRKNTSFCAHLSLFFAFFSFASSLAHFYVSVLLISLEDA
jgi:hypothetical protein